MKYLPLLCLLLCSCVSSGLADANYKSVVSLARASTTAAEENRPVAQEAVDTAAEIVEAAKPLNQVLNLGVDSLLIEKNEDNVETLIATVDIEDPKVAVVADKARENAQVLSDRTAAYSGVMSGLRKTPYLQTILEILTAIGSGVGVLYAGTRGQRHVKNWWNSPPVEKPVEKPA